MKRTGIPHSTPPQPATLQSQYTYMYTTVHSPNQPLPPYSPRVQTYIHLGRRGSISHTNHLILVVTSRIPYSPPHSTPITLSQGTDGLLQDLSGRRHVLSELGQHSHIIRPVTMLCPMGTRMSCYAHVHHYVQKRTTKSLPGCAWCGDHVFDKSCI